MEKYSSTSHVGIVISCGLLRTGSAMIIRSQIRQNIQREGEQENCRTAEQTDHTENLELNWYMYTTQGVYIHKLHVGNAAGHTLFCNTIIFYESQPGGLSIQYYTPTNNSLLQDTTHSVIIVHCLFMTIHDRDDIEKHDGSNDANYYTLHVISVLQHCFTGFSC